MATVLPTQLLEDPTHSPLGGREIAADSERMWRPLPKEQETHLSTAAEGPADSDNRVLRVGDRIRVSGGYWDAPWLGGRSSVDGTVAAFIPSVSDTDDLVARLDAEVVSELGRGDIAILHLRYVGAAWSDTGTVHIELCDFVPDATCWNSRRKGKWVESHATYTRLPRSE
jgi:hypothetical protein